MPTSHSVPCPVDTEVAAIEDEVAAGEGRPVFVAIVEGVEVEVVEEDSMEDLLAVANKTFKYFRKIKPHISKVVVVQHTNYA